MRRRGAWRLAAVLVLALIGAACGGRDGGQAGGADPAGGRGSIVIDGSSTVAPISEAIAEEYRRERAGVDVSVATSGTGGGFQRFCAGEIDVADASREIKEEERRACEAGGVRYTPFRVGLDGLAVVTSARNGFLECLSFEQLALIFKEGGATTWDQVDPRFPREKVAVFGPGTDSGTYDFFVEEVLGDPDEPGTPKARTDYTASEDDNTLVQGVAGETNSWGFFGFAYFKENRDSVKGVEVAKEAGRCVAPSDRTVESGEYPLSRPLFIYVKDTSLDEPHVREFVRFYLEATPEIIREVGYTPAPASDYQQGLDTLEGR